MVKILFEDNHLIAALKPHGQLTQADESGDESLLDEVKAFIKTRDQKPGNVFLGLLHRLDRPVGGVVLFAKTSKAASRLSEQFRSRRVEKVYEAFVEGVPKPQEGTVVQWLTKDKEKNVVTPYDHEVPGSQRAELTYKVLEAGAQSRVEIHPKTGRTHQIRVAMSSLGTPIVGDLKYGAKSSYSPSTSFETGQVALKAVSLTIEHPITKEPLTITLAASSRF